MGGRTGERTTKGRHGAEAYQHQSHTAAEDLVDGTNLHQILAQDGS